MPADEPRAALAAAQTALLAALVAGAPPPDGFDAARLRVQAGTLAAKRARAAAAHHPWLRDALGGTYPARFAAWAATRPLAPDSGGAHADAAAFEARLAALGELPARPAVPRARRRFQRPGRVTKWSPVRRPAASPATTADQRPYDEEPGI